MRWQGRRQSSNVEDRRFSGRGKKPAIGGLGLIIILLVSFLFGGPQAIIDNLGLISSEQVPYTEYVETEEHKELGDFVKVVLADTEDVWNQVQKLLGVMDQMNEIRQKVSETEYNKYSVRLELQADYLAGVWANRIKDMGYIEVGDIDEAIRAAEAVGDDNIQKQARGYVVPDSFTHGTSEQRAHWFLKGYETGDLSNWDTFNNKE